MIENGGILGHPSRQKENLFVHSHVWILSRQLLKQNENYSTNISLRAEAYIVYFYSLSLWFFLLFLPLGSWVSVVAENDSLQIAIRVKF